MSKKENKILMKMDKIKKLNFIIYFAKSFSLEKNKLNKY